MQDFYFIVAFEVPAGKENDFRQELNAISARLSQSSGAEGSSGVLYEVAPEVESKLSEVPGISAALQNRIGGVAAYRFVLIAHWKSLSHYQSALQEAGNGKPISFSAFPAYYRIADESMGEGAEREPAEFTFINPFEIPEGEGYQFHRQWRETIERLNTAPGFLSARLYEVDQEIEAALLQTPGISAVLQNRPQGKARFRYIWVSQWATLTEYETAVRSFGRGAPLPFPSHPAFYQGG
jgi:hypothetical protein